MMWYYCWTRNFCSGQWVQADSQRSAVDTYVRGLVGASVDIQRVSVSVAFDRTPQELATTYVKRVTETWERDK